MIVWINDQGMDSDDTTGFVMRADFHRFEGDIFTVDLGRHDVADQFFIDEFFSDWVEFSNE